MAYYQLRLGKEPLLDLIDRIAADANAVAPGLGRERARGLALELFRARVRQSENCGKNRRCHEIASLWGAQPAQRGAQPPCLMDIEDPFALPNLFARTAADRLEPLSSGEERDSLEERLSTVFRAIIAPLLYQADSCQDPDTCAGDPLDPFRA